MRSLNRENIEDLWTELGSSRENFHHNLYHYRNHMENLGRALDQMDLERIEMECRHICRFARDLGASHMFEILIELEASAVRRDEFRIRQIRTRCEEEMIHVMGDLSDFLFEKKAA